jgi:hypothetical protein
MSDGLSWMPGEQMRFGSRLRQLIVTIRVYPAESLASDVEMRPIRVDFGANETCGWDHILMRRSGGAHIAVKSGQQKTEPTVRRSGKLLGYAWLSSSAWRWRAPG